MANTLITSQGFDNTNYYLFDGVTAVKTPVLPMSLSLFIKNPPPPLFLLINPQSLALNFSKKVNPQKTRADSFTSGYVIQFAKDELDTMTVSGVTATMFHATYGLCTTQHQNTGYDHFLKLLAYFDNNGCDYNDKYTTIIDSVGRVNISYDGVNYYGCFDDFSWKETSTEPFNFTFSWNFTISNQIDSNTYGVF